MDALGIRHLFTQIGQPPVNFGGFSTGACGMGSVGASALPPPAGVCGVGVYACRCL